MTDDDFRNKIISLASARTARANAEINEAAEAEIRASEKLATMLGDALAAWSKTKEATEIAADDVPEVFYFGSLYFIRTLIKVLGSETFSNKSKSGRDLAEKLQSALKDEP
jgi:hypothetical protein